MNIHAAANRGARGMRRGETLLGAVCVLCGSVIVAAQSAPALQFKGSPESKHATIAASPAGVTAAPGGKIAPFVEGAPQANIHVNAPGAEGYIPLTLQRDAPPQVKVSKRTDP